MYLVILSLGDAINSVIEKAFSVTLQDFLIQLLATIVLILVVRFFFWNKVTAFLEARHKIVDSELKNAEKLNEEAKEMKEQVSLEYESIKKEANEIINRAKETSKVEAQAIIDEANEKAKSIIEEGNKEVQREKEKALKEVSEEALTIAAAMASKIIDEEIDENKYDEKILSDLGDKK